jgi:hypothetical protein
MAAPVIDTPAHLELRIKTPDGRARSELVWAPCGSNSAGRVSASQADSSPHTTPTPTDLPGLRLRVRSSGNIGNRSPSQPSSTAVRSNPELLERMTFT